MSNLLLAKPNLPEGWLDCSVGEPHVVREILRKYFKLDSIGQEHPDHYWEYPNPKGFEPLIQILEEKHGYPTIITNGAKQGIGACLYALKKMGKQTVGMMEPYWALIPPLVEMHGLTSAIGSHPFNVDAFLALAPNNPDGAFSYLDCLEDSCKSKSKNIPLIHDAAYYTHVYLPRETELKVYGDAQIFSISKMFGLSGLRIGYVVCKNPLFYKYIQEYMEAMTVGVSIASQVFLTDLLTQMDKHPLALEKFEKEAAAALRAAKEAMLQVDPEVLIISPRSVDVAGMFGWYAKGPKFSQERAKINFIDGSLFGGQGMIRMNLCWNEDQMQEIVSRLNSSKE